MQLELPRTDDRVMYDLWLSMYRYPAASAADELGIFAALHEAPASPHDLARSLDLNAHAIEIILGLLAPLGLVTQYLGRFQLTEAGRTYLLPSSPFYWGGTLHVLRGQLPHHAAFLTAARTKTRAAPTQINQVDKPFDSWAAGQLDLAPARGFAKVMQSLSLPAALGLAKLGCFESTRRLLDVGGGSGCYSIALAQQYPQLRCSVMDLPAMCEVALEYAAAGGVRDRVDGCAIDMLRGEWPKGYDAVFFSNVFHDWDAETCRTLARRAHSILPADGRIYLHEVLLDDTGAGPLHAAAYSAAMLLTTAGRQYTYAELREMLEDAGFAEVTVTSAYGYFSLVQARKIVK
jgi:predicted O-methyltransferase YrrM